MSKYQDSVFIDSSFFKAYIDRKDDFHLQAETIWQQFVKNDTSLLTSNFILDETFTVIRYKSGLKNAITLRETLAESSVILDVKRVTIADEANAWEWFTKDWRKLSFTDCVSFAMMQRLGLRRVAAFDTDFERAGFTLEK